MRYPTSGYLQHLLAPETLIFFNYNNFIHIITSGIHFIERLKELNSVHRAEVSAN